MSIIHQMLYESGDLARIDFRGFIENLTPILAATYQVDPSRVRLAIRAEPVLLSIDAAVPLGLVLNELVSNALKHGFPDGLGGEVTIVLSPESDGRAVLSVSDDGVGIPTEIDLENGTSLGMQLITLLSQQLHAELTISRARPTRFALRFAAQS
jgi:two-component sensor histidine kinase